MSVLAQHGSFGTRPTTGDHSALLPLITQAQTAQNGQCSQKEGTSLKPTCQESCKEACNSAVQVCREWLFGMPLSCMDPLLKLSGFHCNSPPFVSKPGLLPLPTRCSRARKHCIIGRYITERANLSDLLCSKRSRRRRRTPGLSFLRR